MFYWIMVRLIGIILDIIVKIGVSFFKQFEIKTVKQRDELPKYITV